MVCYNLFTMDTVRLTLLERKALKIALGGFQGQVYVFGSRLDQRQKGGDIDILLKPARSGRFDKIRSAIESRFADALQQSLDVVVYDDKSVFCREIIKHARSIDPTSL